MLQRMVPTPEALEKAIWIASAWYGYPIFSHLLVFLVEDEDVKSSAAENNFKVDSSQGFEYHKKNSQVWGAPQIQWKKHIYPP